MNRFKRGLAILLSTCMIGGMIPLPASAEETVSENIVQTECIEKTENLENAPSEDEKSSEKDHEAGSETESETVTDAETEGTAISAIQALIDALPDADSITEDNVENVTSQLDIIDEAKAELSDADMLQLDLTRYDVAINKVMVLMGMKEENDSEIAVQTNDSAGKTEQQSTDEAIVYQSAVETTDKYDIDDDGTKDTVYEISNAGQLYWFAGLVNGTLDGVEQNTLANAILTANITVNENLLDSLQYDTEGNVSNGSDFISWTPIADCMEDHITLYSGTFDGNNKTVSGLYFNDNSTRIGLFGSSEADGNIKNVGVVDSYFKGNDFVGGVCGRNDGTITNCYNAGNLTVIESSATIGGICGYNSGTVTNCYNTGTVTATGQIASVGGVCGCSMAPISNCYNIGTVTATSSSTDISGICGYNFGPVTNCYYLADTEDENGGKTAAQFASGEIAYLLSQGYSTGEGDNTVTYDGSIWGQALGGNGDTYPVLDITKRVYQVDKYDGCEGKPGSSTKVYSNQSTSIYEEHKYEADTTDSTKHKCSICNGTEEHSFAYEFVENGNAIKATCSECGATYTVKLTQPAATSDEKIVYDGTEKEAGTAIDSGNTGIETIPENAITYAAVTNGTPSTYSTAAPKNAGTYKAKLTLGTGDNRVSIEINFTIEKAASPTIAGEEKSYAYSVGSDGKTIGVDIAGKLPTDRGTTTYAVVKTDTEQLLSEVAVDTTGNLTYKVNQVDSTKVGKTAIITVTASMENYENAEYTLTISSITDKKTVEIKSGNTVSVDGSNVLIYGEKISKLTLGNTVFVEAGTDNMVEGILSWSNPDEIPATGTTQAGWVFKPTDSRHYVELTGTAAITVVRATPAVVTVPTVAEREYNPAVALADSDMTGGSVTGADGSSLAGTWSFTGTNIIPTVNNKGYQAVFTPDDADNYNTVTRTITVKVTKATPVIAEKPTASVLTYGQTLSDSTLTGGKVAYQTADGTEITGTFAWKNSSSKPTVADSQKTEYDVTFTPSDKDNYNAVDTKLALTVNKAASVALSGESRSYIYAKGSNDKAETMDVAGKLPADRGTTTYAVATTDTEQLLSEVTVDTAGNLTYKVNQVDSSKVGKTAIITVTASMENYENVGYTLTISITDKKTVEIKRGNTVSVEGSNVLIYGEKISKLTLGNTVFVEAGTDNMVEGILSWSNPDEIPATGTTQAGWVFKPADSKHYEDLTGTAAITVARATPAVVTVPAVAERVYNPAVALADSDMTGGSVTGADGSSLAGTWSFTGTIIIPTVNNKGYQAVFTPDDTNNYNTATRTITVKVTKATPVIAEKPTAGALTYGQKLSDSTLTGGKAVYQTADGTEITGAFAWKNGSIKPTAADSQKTEYDVTFTPSDKDNYNAVDTKLALTVNKAALAALSGESRSYIYAEGSNDKAETMDVAGKLPADRGTTAYSLTKTYNEQLLSDVAVDQDGNLTYKVNEADKSHVGAATTITVLASMENYEDAVYTMTIRITDKKFVTLKSGNTVSVNGSNALTYGDKLSELGFSDVTFVDADTNTEVKGTLEWADPDCIPTAGTTQAGWVFKPDDSKYYEDLTGTAAITVAKATPAVVTVPAVAEREYNPAVALADSDMTGGSVTGADGSSLAGTWSFTGTNIVPTVNNKGYQAVFTPNDTNNYNTVTGTITVKVTKATPVIAEKPTAGALTYGQKLSDSTLTGGKAAYQTADGTEITGTFAWKNSSSKPTVADSGKIEYDVTFTPSDTANYNAVGIKLSLTVNKAAKAPNMPETTMAPAHSTKKVGEITLPDGWSWQEDDKDTALADGVAVTATAVYTGADKGNYETESVSITITRSECDHTHTEIRNQRETTCKEEGYTGDTYCKDCGEKLATGTATGKKPHTVGTPATCVSKAVCSVCGETFGEVDATNHVHTTLKNRREATCTQTGYTGDTYCKDCDKLLSTGKELAALGHDYKATVTKQPTTTEEGIRTYTCTRCNRSYTESIAKLPEEQHTHNYTGSITKEATCTEAGVRTYTCSCGDSYTENIPATGHSYVSKVTKAATTTEEGIMTYTCSKCGHSYTQPIAKIKSDDSSKDNGSQNQKSQSGTDNGNQNQKPQPDTDNGKDNSTSIKPYIKDESGKEGWDVIKPQLEETEAGDTVTVAMNGTTVVPKDVIDSIKGKDTTLVLDMGNGLSWKIYGKDITDAAGDIDFDVTVGADAGKSIPVDVINNVTGERSSLNLTLAYDGEFGFTATLTVNMESKNAGLYANLFYYNEQTGELEFISAGQIDSDGNVELEFTHASDYTIVVDAKIMSDNGQADNKADETIPASKTDDSTSKYAWNNTIIIIIGICIMLIVIGAIFYVRKQSGSEEE